MHGVNISQMSNSLSGITCNVLYRNFSGINTATITLNSVEPTKHQWLTLAVRTSPQGRDAWHLELQVCTQTPFGAPYYSKVKYYMGYSSLPLHATPLQELTYYMESHSVIYHPAEVTFPPLPQPKLVLDLVISRNEGWVDLARWLQLRWHTCPKTVTHPITNRAQCQVTSSICWHNDNFSRCVHAEVYTTKTATSCNA